MLRILQKDLVSLIRHRMQWTQTALFYVIFVIFFVLAFGFDVEKIQELGPTVIWLAFMVTILFSIEAMLQEEKEQGAIGQWLFSPYPLWALMLIKSLVIWLVSCGPLIAISWILALSVGLSWLQIKLFMLTLLLGSPALVWLGLLMKTLTLSAPRSGIMLGLLLLPLYVPVLILGESAMLSVVENVYPTFQLWLLAAFSTLAGTMAPLGMAGALKSLLG